MKFKKLLVSIIFLAITLLLPQVSFAGNCDFPDYCDTQPRPANHTGDPNPGDKCYIDGVNRDAVTGKVLYDYRYSKGTCLFDFTNSNSCNVGCGLLWNGFCCEPVNKSSHPSQSSNSQPPPCAQYATNGQCNTTTTAIGDIPTNIQGFVQSILGIILGLSGGTAMLLIIAAGYQIMTSQGNPEKVKDGRERLTAAIVGLLFIIFSTAILQIVGIDFLHLPGFSR